MVAKELTELIKKQMERGPHNLSMPEKNLYKAKWEKTMEDLKEINKKKNDLVDEILALLHKTIKPNMPKPELEAVDKMEAKLMEEITSNNHRHEELVLHFAEQSQPLLPPNPQAYMQPP